MSAPKTEPKSEPKSEPMSVPRSGPMSVTPPCGGSAGPGSGLHPLSSAASQPSVSPVPNPSIGPQPEWSAAAHASVPGSCGPARKRARYSTAASWPSSAGGGGGGAGTASREYSTVCVSCRSTSASWTSAGVSSSRPCAASVPCGSVPKSPRIPSSVRSACRNSIRDSGSAIDRSLPCSVGSDRTVDPGPSRSIGDPAPSTAPALGDPAPHTATPPPAVPVTGPRSGLLDQAWIV